MEQEPGPTGPKEPRPSDSYLKYSSFALQLFGGVGFAAWGGYYVDKYLELKFPVFLLSFVFIVFAGMMFQMYKNLNK